MAQDDDIDDVDSIDDDDDYDRPIKKKKRKGASSGSPFVDFLIFKMMVGPWILIVVFWLVVVLCVGGGLVFIVLSFINMKQIGVGPGMVGVLTGLAMMVLYPILARVYFELAICVYRILETLVEIRDKL